MPIRPRQADIHPPELLADSPATLASDLSWWALHTLPRQEKSLMAQLLEAGIAFYSPLAPHEHRTAKGRKLVSWPPLFPGYVFLCGTDEDRRQALRTKRVLRALPIVDSERLIHDLRQIQRLLASGLPIGREPRIPPGTIVRVCTGPLAGMQGVVLKRRGREQLLVAVDFLQQGASVALDEWVVEPADP